MKSGFYGKLPSRKYSGAIGDNSLSLRMPFSKLWWKLDTVFMTDGLIGKAARPAQNRAHIIELNVTYNREYGIKFQITYMWFWF